MSYHHGGGGGGICLVALSAFLPSVSSSFFTQNKMGASPLGPSHRAATGCGTVLHNMRDQLKSALLLQSFVSFYYYHYFLVKV